MAEISSGVYKASGLAYRGERKGHKWTYEVADITLVLDLDGGLVVPLDNLEWPARKSINASNATVQTQHTNAFDHAILLDHPSYDR